MEIDPSDTRKRAIVLRSGSPTLHRVILTVIWKKCTVMRNAVMAPQELTSRNYWLWVTRPEYYLDDDRSDREDLDPETGESAAVGGPVTKIRSAVI